MVKITYKGETRNIPANYLKGLKGEDRKKQIKSIFEGIDAAKSYILVQFFIVENDYLGKKLKTKLIKKAREGVQVYFI